MVSIKLLFFLGIFTIFYSYLGYGFLLWLYIKIKNRFTPPGDDKKSESDNPPPVTFIVAAFNEEEFIEKKIRNTLSLDYPEASLNIIFITDGSTDQTPDIIKRYPQITLLHSPTRRGKIAAIHRAMSHVSTRFVIFSDANTQLDKQSIRKIIQHYEDPTVGGVAGEKKIVYENEEAINGAGEGIYWKYESFLKKLDWAFYTVVGAAGELFSIRTELYEHPGNNVLLDDFLISLRICQKGYRIAYEPKAYATETPSSSLREEQKRKIRISAGAFQSMYLLKSLLNIFKYKRLSFLYISHRVLRWTLCPIALPVILLTNLILVKYDPQPFYTYILWGQALFYCFALLGWLLSLIKIRISILYVFYYFIFMNISLYIGFFRFLKGRQSVLWEKAARTKAQQFSK